MSHKYNNNFFNQYHWLIPLYSMLVALFVYQNIQRGLFAAGVEGFNQYTHYFDSVLNVTLIPGLVFISGFAHAKIVLLSNRNNASLPIKNILFDNFLYCFFLWSIFQGLIEILFSGYTGGKDT